MMIGARVNSGCSSTLDTYYSGQLDDIKVFNYAVTATQVKTLMTDGNVRFGPVTGTP